MGWGFLALRGTVAYGGGLGGGGSGAGGERCGPA